MSEINITEIVKNIYKNWASNLLQYTSSERSLIFKELENYINHIEYTAEETMERMREDRYDARFHFL